MHKAISKCKSCDNLARKLKDARDRNSNITFHFSIWNFQCGPSLAMDPFSRGLCQKIKAYTSDKYDSVQKSHNDKKFLCWPYLTSSVEFENQVTWPFKISVTLGAGLHNFFVCRRIRFLWHSLRESWAHYASECVPWKVYKNWNEIHGIGIKVELSWQNDVFDRYTTYRWISDRN